MSSRFGMTTAILGTILGLSLSACSDDHRDDPSTPTTTVTTPSLPDSGAPKVENPIDTKRFEAKPCTVAATSKLAKAGLEFRKTEAELDSAFGPACTWFYRQDRFGVISGRFTAISDRGLSGLYAKRDEWVLFEELTVAGYPAVIYDDIERQETGYCPLAVGIRDDQTYDVIPTLGVQHPNRKNPCEVAKAFAEIAVTTMQGGQG